MTYEKTSLPAYMALSLGNQKGEHVGTHSAVQVDDAHKTAFSFIEQCVTREYLYFYGTVVTSSDSSSAMAFPPWVVGAEP